MGINKYNSWIISTYEECITKDPSYNDIYDFIYIDINHLLHNSMYDVLTEDAFYNKLKFFLNKIFNTYLCRKKIIIAIDGPSPYCKLLVQRKRRLDMSLNNDSVNDINPMSITPGTVFMNNLDIFLKKYINNIKKRYKYINIDIDLLLSNIPDEGELKIFNALNLNCTNHMDKHLVVGNDADLIVLAMANKKTYNIDILIHLKKNHYLISKLKLCKLFSQKIYNDPLEYYNKNSTDDFCIISLLCGNDYLPKLYYSNFTILWDAYKDTKSLYNNYNIINDGLFNIPFLKSYMLNINSKLLKQFQKFKLKKFNYNIVADYLKGLLWCLNMYSTGKCSDYSFMFNHSTSVTPIDIYYFLEFNEQPINIPSSDIKPLTVDVCLLMLLPKKMNHLLPSYLQSIPDKYFNDLHIYYDEQCTECVIYKDFIKTITNVHKKIKNDKLKNTITTCNKLYTAHKKNHPQITIDVIQQIINIVNSSKFIVTDK